MYIACCMKDLHLLINRYRSFGSLANIWSYPTVVCPFMSLLYCGKIPKIQLDFDMRLLVTPEVILHIR